MAYTAILTIFVPVLILLLWFLVTVHFQLRATQRRRRLPPGPTPLPIVGCLLSMLRHKHRSQWLLRVTEGMDIACVRLGNTHVIVANTPEFANEFFKHHDATFASRPTNMATEYLTRGYLALALCPWDKQCMKMRRVVQSELTSHARLRSMEGLRTEETDHIMRFIYNQCESSSSSTSSCEALIDVRNTARYYYGNLFRRMFFGKRHFGEGGAFGGPGVEEMEHQEAAFTAISLNNAFRTADFLPFLRFLDWDGHEKAMKSAVDSINKYHDPIIDERSERWKREGGVGRSAKTNDLVDVMFSLKDDQGKPLLTTEEIKAMAADLVYGLIENASNIVEWSLASMVHYPSVMRRAVEELDRVVGKDRLVQESDLSKLVFLKACARETIRLHPVSHFNLPHVALHDTIVQGYFIPKDSQVLVNRLRLGRNPKLWTDPHTFNPGRHLINGNGDTEMNEQSLEFVSFSVGRRGCTSVELGTLITYMLLARLVQVFKWHAMDGTGIDLSEDEHGGYMANQSKVYASPRLDILKFI